MPIDGLQGSSVFPHFYRKDVSLGCGASERGSGLWTAAWIVGVKVGPILAIRGLNVCLFPHKDAVSVQGEVMASKEA